MTGSPAPSPTREWRTALDEYIAPGAEPNSPLPVIGLYANSPEPGTRICHPFQHPSPSGGGHPPPSNRRRVEVFVAPAAAAINDPGTNPAEDGDDDAASLLDFFMSAIRVSSSLAHPAPLPYPRRVSTSPSDAVDDNAPDDEVGVTPFTSTAEPTSADAPCLVTQPTQLEDNGGEADSDEDSDDESSVDSDFDTDMLDEDSDDDCDGDGDEGGMSNGVEGGTARRPRLGGSGGNYATVLGSHFHKFIRPDLKMTTFDDWEFERYERKFNQQLKYKFQQVRENGEDEGGRRLRSGARDCVKLNDEARRLDTNVQPPEKVERRTA
eukprot:CAMPEP_0172532406 /NCGR_PEP_ID=MMETSP1067-20121228/5473_1 /TAXON_ID=265564 ORGANISM="Thalassiosira punctigera, Strain Tpunct2005C2" /NCGR_SAMPLE_ID=MMETSP1067 /ASSEMBLY_ACC=CAM_ASM_000444 /LENGTH=322 /DNA_ID=CAMNT_0013316917 /DNA_START=58 /DNA_END=1022 /DNA_ORIENTATION=+